MVDPIRLHASRHPGYRKAQAGETTCAGCTFSWSHMKGGVMRHRCLGPSPAHANNYLVLADHTCRDARAPEVQLAPQVER